MEGYDPSIIETYPLGVRLVIVRFCYPGNTIFEGLYQVHSPGDGIGVGRGEERYVERTHLYIGEQNLHEDEESSVLFVYVFEDMETWFLMSLYHPREMQATCGRYTSLSTCVQTRGGAPVSLCRTEDNQLGDLDAQKLDVPEAIAPTD